MNLKNKIANISLILLFATSSCSTPKDITYFQDIANGQIIESENIASIRVKPEDKLSIIVNTQDPALSSLFNLVQVQNHIQSTTTNTKKIGEAANGGSGQTSYYTVNSMGNINFPVIGEIHIAGMTRGEVADFIKEQLITEDLVKDPIVTVEFANTGITILGEVSSPGRYEFNKDRLTILEAIGMAGDLTINGMRTNILVIRPDGNGKEKFYFVNLTDVNSIYSSPVFYLQQDDVIYVAPNDKKKRETTPNGNTPYTPSFWVSMGSFGVTIATLIITLTK